MATDRAVRKLIRGASWKESGTPAPSAGNGSAMRAGLVGLVYYDDTERLVEVIVVDAFLAQLRDWVRPLESSFADYVLELSQWVELPPEQAAEPISPAGKDPGYVDGWRGVSPFVIPSVLWSLYSFLRTPDDYWETICTAITVGGDVDTTAAMAGAISGTWVGLEAIPDGLARQVNDMGAWGYEALVNLADKAYETKMN